MAYFRPFLPNLGQMGFFFKNRAPLRKTSYRPKTSCKKSEKSLHCKYKKNVKNVDLWKKLKELTQSSSVEWNWVKGHSEDPMNDLADKLAKRATPV